MQRCVPTIVSVTPPSTIKSVIANMRHPIPRFQFLLGTNQKQTSWAFSTPMSTHYALPRCAIAKICSHHCKRSHPPTIISVAAKGEKFREDWIEDVFGDEAYKSYIEGKHIINTNYIDGKHKHIISQIQSTLAPVTRPIIKVILRANGKHIIQIILRGNTNTSYLKFDQLWHLWGNPSWIPCIFVSSQHCWTWRGGFWRNGKGVGKSDSLGPKFQFERPLPLICVPSSNRYSKIRKTYYPVARQRLWRLSGRYLI